MNEDKIFPQAPLMTVGKYAGKPVDHLPHSYLRWLITQDFPKEIVDCAVEKLKHSGFNDLNLHVTRHAIDMFSKRFLNLWIQSELSKDEETAVGLASFIAVLAQEAWDNGTDMSKHRHQDDGVIKLYKEIQWVFNENPNFPEYRDVITVME